MEHNLTFGQWLKQLRKAMDLTQKELAQLVDCSVETIRKIEADVRRPSRQIAQRLADRLELPPEVIASFIRQARVPAGPEAGAGQVTSLPDQRPANLLVPPTPLIGRDQDVLRICKHLSSDAVRLLTLTGAPGIGKTRLALQVAAVLAATFADGVVFVALAQLTAPDLVAAAVAEALGIAEAAGASLVQELKQALYDKQLLLVLDTFEHVLAAAPLLADLLAVCPRLKILITSRAVLLVRGEQEFPVGPLELPDPSHLPPLDQLARCPSVALFTARTRAVQPDFSLTVENMAAVAAICVRLEGIPLAIELVAILSKLFPPQAILARLDQCLPMLTTGARDLPARQRSLRDAIAWSYHLLDAGEQALFRRLGVFAGGWTLEAAEAVTDEEPGAALDSGPTACSLVNRLSSLAGQSLIQRADGAGGEPRFAMLELIREYALELLAQSGELEAIGQRHAQFYLALAEEAELVRQAGEPEAWPDRLAIERDNVGVALRWALDHGWKVPRRVSVPVRLPAHTREHKRGPPAGSSDLKKGEFEGAAPQEKLKKGSLRGSPLKKSSPTCSLGSVRC